MGAELQNLIKEISELRDGDTSNDSIDWNIILNHSLNLELEKTLSCADISVLNALIDELYFFRNRDWSKKISKDVYEKFIKYNNGEHWSDNWDKKKWNRHYNQI